MSRALPFSALMVLAGAGLAIAGSTAEVVTLRAHSTIIRSTERPVLLGEVSPGQAGEYVAVQGRECGVPGAFFRGMGGATTVEGGSWTTDLVIQRTTITFRAVWKEAVSEPVTVQQRINVWLLKERGVFRSGVSGEVANVNGAKLVIQRRTPAGWKRLKTLVLKSQGYRGSAERTGLHFAVPKGTTLRAYFPLSQAKPCYLAGYSKLIRT